uniref:Uncharacterized protein n=1 Tax=Marseillevirus LCMAC101 TaxID=2506602 RepID=A0A481YR12_9VIRU|nr:MAG: hypothetical protein LCMAC101_02980 [Marseillevirus LCMAC101]
MEELTVDLSSIPVKLSPEQNITNKLVARINDTILSRSGNCIELITRPSDKVQQVIRDSYKKKNYDVIFKESCTFCDDKPKLCDCTKKNICMYFSIS